MTPLIFDRGIRIDPLHTDHVIRTADRTDDRDALRNAAFSVSCRRIHSLSSAVFRLNSAIRSPLWIMVKRASGPQCYYSAAAGCFP